jgi:hypothetical protein
MATTLEIYRELARFLAGEQSLDSFHGWLAVNTWDDDLRSDPQERQLAGSIELALAEFSLDHLNAKELREQFSRLIVNQNLKLRDKGLIEVEAASPSAVTFSLRAPLAQAA